MAGTQLSSGLSLMQNFLRILRREIAARDDRHAHRGEIIRADRIHVRLGMSPGRRRRVAFHGHASCPIRCLPESASIAKPTDCTPGIAARLSVSC